MTATRVLFSDIDGTLAHYLEDEKDTDGKLVGKDAILEIDTDEGGTGAQGQNRYAGTYKCVSQQVR